MVPVGPLTVFPEFRPELSSPPTLGRSGGLRPRRWRACTAAWTPDLGTVAELTALLPDWLRGLVLWEAGLPDGALGLLDALCAPHQALCLA